MVTAHGDALGKESSTTTLGQMVAATPETAPPDDDDDLADDVKIPSTTPLEIAELGGDSGVVGGTTTTANAEENLQVAEVAHPPPMNESDPQEDAIEKGADDGAIRKEAFGRNSELRRGTSSQQEAMLVSQSHIMQMTPDQMDANSSHQQSMSLTEPHEVRAIEIESIPVDNQSFRSGMDDRMADLEEKKLKSRTRMSYMIGIVVVLLAVIVAVTVAVILLTRDDNNSSSDEQPTVSTTPSPTPPMRINGTAYSVTMNDISTRGKLRCGLLENTDGFSTDAAGNIAGFDVDLCNAIAAALFGSGFSSDKLEFFPVSAGERFLTLQSGTVDVLAALTTHTMERDIYERAAKAGFSFSEPYLYDSLGFGGLAEFVDCADRNDVTSPICTGLRLCVPSGTTYVDVILGKFPSSVISNPSTADAYYGSLSDGRCNVLAGGQFEIATEVVRSNGYFGPYVLGNETLSSEPLALVTRDGDPAWSDFVNWVLLSLMHAEEEGSTQSSPIPDVEQNPFGSEYSEMFSSAVSAVGNFAEVYIRNLQRIVPRQAINMINDGTQPLISSRPFGTISTFGSSPPASSTLEMIRSRGFLRCGVQRAPGFSNVNTTMQRWSGLLVDYCNGIAAAIFDGLFDNKVDFVELRTSADRWPALASGEVDLLSWPTTLTFMRDVHIAEVGTGFSFSPILFYDDVAYAGEEKFVTCAELARTIDECQGLKICVARDTTTSAEVLGTFAAEFVVDTANVIEAIRSLQTGLCNVVAGDRSTLTVSLASSAQYNFSTLPLSREPLALVTRQDDPQFAAFVWWMVAATFYAEEEGINKTTAQQMPQLLLFGANQYLLSLIRMIEAVGNYGEIYSRNLEGLSLSRDGGNRLNVSPFGPRIYVPPGL